MAKVVLDLDNRVPTLSGETMRDFKVYEKMVRAHVLSQWAKDAEEKKAKMNKKKTHKKTATTLTKQTNN